MSASKEKGTKWETEIIAYLQSRGWEGAERRVLYGERDRGDVLGLPGLVIEAKNERTATWAAYLDEAEREAANAGGELGVAWVHRRGRSSPAAGFVLMSGRAFCDLLRLAGW